MLLRVVTPLINTGAADEARVLQLIYFVPQRLAQNAETVQTGYREYQELVVGRLGLKRLYGITLTLTLLLSLLSALAAAIFLSEELSAPLNALVEGTRAVAQGDFTRRATVASRDELGQLTQSFNSMTLQLAEARSLAERNQAEVAQAKANLESVLAHLSAGVLVFDHGLVLQSANPSALEILGPEARVLLGTGVRQWERAGAPLGALGREIEAGFHAATKVFRATETQTAGGVLVGADLVQRTVARSGGVGHTNVDNAKHGDTRLRLGHAGKASGKGRSKSDFLVHDECPLRVLYGLVTLVLALKLFDWGGFKCNQALGLLSRRMIASKE